jgi:hypothetical protein
LFAPRREHARFCSARCRVAWNRQNASEPPPEAGALDWSVTALREATDRILRADGWDRPQAFEVISEAVWRVTMVDATLVRYHSDTYSAVLAGRSAAERAQIEETFAGLRFVRNRMGYYADRADFIELRESTSGHDAGPTRAWAWRSVPRPTLVSLSPRGRDWEMGRYQAYQNRLAGQSVRETFSLAATFLQLVSAGSLSRR